MLLENIWDSLAIISAQSFIQDTLSFSLWVCEWLKVFWPILLDRYCWPYTQDILKDRCPEIHQQKI